MDNHIHLALNASDRSYFAILKKEVHAMAVAGGLPEKRIAELDIIVAEIVTNLVKHAGGGQVLAKLIEENGKQGIELISIDNGPGMTDVTRMVADGVSTKNTLGNGLGAIKRLSDVFQIYSMKNWGTVILVRVFDKTSTAKKFKTEIRSVIIPKPGETESGDDFYSIVDKDYVKLFLGDGLGHGPEAAKAMQAAGNAFMECPHTDPVDIIRYINLAVKRTRGMVGTVAVFDLASKKWRICGVGNIITKVLSPGNSKSYLTYNGIIGLNVPNTLSAQEIPHEDGQYILMSSDGLKTRWDTSRYTSIMRYDLSILCASLIKDFARLTDDMSAVACKINL
ncbi:ATP-binding SpoIIE family protein phosphatase [Chitinophaga sancti]|uniref:ATP-binding SpoIIE family protein phosphatase n=1 Tax=Chitinophaga sancti TaxID=1004 RepID=A0A1K1M313_9BACT|nr:ATP-binding SpoIIE family protein phosphatase [Chitinophaga sancti]WQD64673.1 ATP-binding SpoIIE family protein phosphatase [Chitinophaga sancti]WQG89705.1 ATP-binding SpoIIE family protein phosphatase [Chitinophaga sancti]SFW17488.1 Anti-sigma regulatory factor (Ser/Thr protein kinase) [Chitinophaga sancti]